MALLVITGTNTDVGKTYATAALARVATSMSVATHVVKPAQTGEPVGKGDLATVRQLCPEVDSVTEYARYPEPLAPNIAARRAGLPQLELATVADSIRELDQPGSLVLVEGAGGLLVRLADDWTLADLALELNAPLCVVSSLGLGSLNLAELTVETARQRGLSVVGIIGGNLSPEPDLATRLNLNELGVVTDCPYLGSLPAGQPDLDDRSAARSMIHALCQGDATLGVR